MESPPSASPTAPAPELLAGITRPTWLANRAANALQRPAFIGAISIGTFVIAIVSLVMAPRMADSAQHPLPVSPRPDTLSVAGEIALARSSVAQWDSALVVARHQIDSAATVRDTAAPIDTVLRDSLSERIALLTQLGTRAEQAPLLSSYRTLASVPELRADSRVAPLLDSLAEIERERDGFGAVGGVDPVFVALTSQANEVGKRITDIAAEHVNKLRSQLPEAADTTIADTTHARVDTVRFAAARDSALRSADSASAELARLRALSSSLDAHDAAIRAQQSAVAPPVALLATAVVLSAVFGFAAALIGELRHPRVSDHTETERLLRTRVLSVVSPTRMSAERSRRESDRAAPRWLDPHGEGHQLAYLGVSNTHPAQLGVTVTGDDPAIAAVIACNLAAVAADEARNALVLDLTASGSASATLRTRRSPGISDVVRGAVDWADATIAARVGRNKTIDIIPRGSSHTPVEAVAVIRRDAPRFRRYYDAVFVIMDERDARAQAADLAERDTVYCARRGQTRLSHLAAQLNALKNGGAFVSGIVLWSGPNPVFEPASAPDPVPADRPLRPERLAAANSA